MKNYIIAGILLLFLSGASLFLPSYIMEWRDEQRTEKSQVEEVQEVVLKEQVSMTLSEKLKLRGQETVNALELVNGKNYNQDTINEQVRKEIGILAEQGLLADADMDSPQKVEATVSFYVDMEDSERSIMLWEGFADSQDYQLAFTMDDETGKILSFSQYSYDRGEVLYDDYGMQSNGMSVTKVIPDEPDIGTEELQEMAERWGDYLGYKVTESHSAWMEEGLGAEELELYAEQVERMISKGYSREEAEIMASREWGIATSERQLYVNLEDEGDQIRYLLHPERYVFRIEPIIETIE